MDSDYYSDAVKRIEARGGRAETLNFYWELTAMATDAMSYAKIARDDAKDAYGFDLDRPTVGEIFVPLYEAMIKRHMEGGK